MANRPKRTPIKDEKFFEALRGGASVAAAAAAAGYKRRTLYEWREADDEFRAEWEASLEEGTDALEDEALRRALHGTDEPVYYQGEECGYVRKYSDTLTIFLLKARRPEKYREKIDLNHGGQAENPIRALIEQVSGTALRPSSDEAEGE